MKKIFRASLLYFIQDPLKCERIEDCLIYFEDAILIISEGKIEAVGDYTQILEKLEIDQTQVDTRYQGDLIFPGFIDTHIHYPQTEIIGSYGEQLLSWLNKYAFPAEKKFSDLKYSDLIAEFFILELFKNGTTTAMAYATVHKNSCESLFQIANKYNMRLLAGKILMDRNAPKELCDTAQNGYEETLELIQNWHKKNRLLYTITPRFAPTSTNRQLELAGELKENYPSAYIQTHLSENLDEIAWVKSLFNDAKNYLDVYDKFGLLTSKSIFGHAIHLEPSEYEKLEEKKASVSLCPTSNLFLGSGLFKFRKFQQHNIKIGFGSDIGAGTTFNMFKTLSEAYKIISLEQSQNQKRTLLRAFEAFYHSTLGASKSLSLDDKIGKLQEGYEADFVVIDFYPTELFKLRMKKIEDENSDQISALEEKLFALMMIGDDRNIKATFINGEKVYTKL